MKAVLDNLKELGLARLLVLGGVAAVLLGLLATMAVRDSRPDMVPLYRDLDAKDAAEMVDQLDKAHIDHTVSPQGDEVSVPRGDVAAARLALARNGLPGGGAVGYEIFDRGGSLTSTQFEQGINETRAMEGELERSIRLISGVKRARVHVVLPHRDLFSTQEQPSQASVLLAMQGRGRLDPEGVQAILNLVSAAIPGLKAQNISVVDTNGDVLARARALTGANQDAQDEDERRRALEMRLAHAVEEMLAPTLGADHVRAEASVTMNMDRVKETQEKYDPDQQVLRSQQTTTSKNVNTEPPQNVSVSNNLPNANAGQQQAGSQENRQEETNNYEIGKTVRTLVQDQPRIQHLSVAVMVDGTVVRGADGKPVWAPRPAEELERLTTLVRTAVGYDAARGDTVSVVSMRFNTDDLGAAEDAPHGLAAYVQTGTMLQLVRTAIVGMVLFLIMFFVVRPALRGKGLVPGESTGLAEGGAAFGALPGSSLDAVNAMALSPGVLNPGTLALASPPGLSPADDLVSMDGVEGHIKAASIRKVIEIVNGNMDDTLMVIRNWLNADSEGR
ncbi:flagellar M-ring protein FliF [Ameyamaea chiangmaiensis]|uniref:Flagellar M-ring protein n=1 Tax=Ameyamaea chiangmaiensis TaxID=442969 RepID=A0A850PG45_9PROT|nr:flagellar basal-body MS-ring/collar protein FliF [Ameyamaea chiangmaiensis]MBS4074754.1 flagellar M-ring protein FliF [Ameyamaea chiangmaiensis]NVN40131.1 flagellar M-ring protein FliF [Ameyamaea chiangmaiensis]